MTRQEHDELKSVRDYILYWNAGTDEIETVQISIPYELRAHIDRKYKQSIWACMYKYHTMTEEQLTAQVWVDAMHLVVYGKMKPELVHRTFLEFKEYRRADAYDGLSSY